MSQFRAVSLPSFLLASMIGSAGMAADAEHPVVIELFQSQGCSSCPPANANLNTIAGRADVLALSFAVTYWDRLGWKDIFAHPAFTARQWEYARAGERGNVSTPQMIVNGRGVLIGHRGAELADVIKRFDRGTGGPRIDAAPGRVTIGAGQARRPANVWLVRYDPRTRQVPIRAGENGGRTLPHRNIVRRIELLGKWTGPLSSYPVARAADPVWRSAILVQDGAGGTILAARGI